MDVVPLIPHVPELPQTFPMGMPPEQRAHLFRKVELALEAHARLVNVVRGIVRAHLLDWPIDDLNDDAKLDQAHDELVRPILERGVLARPWQIHWQRAALAVEDLGDELDGAPEVAQRMHELSNKMLSVEDLFENVVTQVAAKLQPTP